MSGALFQRPPLDLEVGQRCRKVRESRRLGLKSVAPLVDLDQGTLSRMERGERPMPRTAVRELARIYGVPAYYLEFGTPAVVHVLIGSEESGEGIAAFTNASEADEWATLANSAPGPDYRVVTVPVDDTETLRLFAEERLAAPIVGTKEG